MRGITGYIEDPAIKVPPFVNALSLPLQDHVLNILNGTLALDQSLKEQGVWSGEMDVLGGMIEGDPHRVRLFVKPWPEKIAYQEVNALLSDMLRRDAHMLVRASVEVCSMETGRHAAAPALYIELNDSPARAVHASKPTVPVRHSSRPELLPADVDALAVLQHDASDYETAKRVTELVRSFHTSYTQPRLHIKKGSDVYKVELRFSHWLTDIQYAQLRAIVDLNMELEKRPVIREQLFFQWGKTPEDCYLSVQLQKAAGSEVFHYTKPDYPGKRGMWKPSGDSRELRVRPDFRRIVADTRQAIDAGHPDAAPEPATKRVRHDE